MGDNPDQPSLRIESNMNERQYLADFLSDIEELNSYDSILDQLNQSGDLLGFSFKKEPMTKRKKDKPPTALTIVCKCYNRNPGRSANSDTSCENGFIKDINCKVFYRFNVNPDGSVY